MATYHSTPCHLSEGAVSFIMTLLTIAYLRKLQSTIRKCFNMTTILSMLQHDLSDTYCYEVQDVQNPNGVILDMEQRHIHTL